jgi:hypothetical protein
MQDIHVRNIVPTMDGVTTAIIAFLFLCLAMPHLVKNKTQYYVALAAIVLIIFLHALAVPLNATSFVMFAAFATGILQIVAILMIILCVGGMTMHELRGDLANAYEVIRRGEEKKEVIIPMTGQKPRSKDTDSAGDAPPVVKLDVPGAAKPARRDQSTEGGIPLE